MDAKEIIKKAFAMCETDEPENITLSEFEGVKVIMNSSGIEI